MHRVRVDIVTGAHTGYTEGRERERERERLPPPLSLSWACYHQPPPTLVSYERLRVTRGHWPTTAHSR